MENERTGDPHYTPSTVKGGNSSARHSSRG